MSSAAAAWVMLLCGVAPATLSLDAALRRAAEQRRPVVVEVTRPDCVPCRHLERALEAPSVVRARRGVLLARVDGSLDEEPLDEYGVQRFPTLLLLDHRGRVLARYEGALDAEDLGSLLERLSSGYPDYVRASAVDDPVARRRVTDYLATLRDPREPELAETPEVP